MTSVNLGGFEASNHFVAIDELGLAATKPEERVVVRGGKRGA
jgi:hypothetical protein